MEIQGFSDYIIYEDGRVFSKKRSGKFLKPRKDNHGYLMVHLCNQGKAKTMKIHRLLALHYIPNPNNYPLVDHIDRNRCNNDISNLRWVDASMNCQNRGMRCDNTSGIKNISYDKSQNIYVYKKMIRGKKYGKCFKTLEDAIEYKNAFDIKK